MLIIMYTLTGLLIAGLALPMLLRRVRPNPLYGLRVPATLGDERVWYEANARSGRDLLILGIVTVAAAVLLPLTGISETAYAITLTAILLVGAVGACIVGWRYANRLRDENRDGGQSSPRSRER